MKLRRPIVRLLWGWIFPALITTASAQTLKFQQVPPIPVCISDSVRCVGDMDFPFKVVAPDTLVVKVDYQLELNGAIQQKDNYGLLTGNFPNYRMLGRYPRGSHRWHLRATSDKGDTLRLTVPFRIVDCKAPAPTLKSVLSLTTYRNTGEPDVNGDLVPDKCIITVAAKDFIIADNRDCSGPVRYSINLPGEDPDPNRATITLTTMDQFVEIYAWDNADNPQAVQPDGTIGGPNVSGYVAAVLLANPPGECCCQPPSVSGNVSSVQGQGVSGVTMILDDGLRQDTIKTNEGGNFQLLHRIDHTRKYTVRPFKDDDHLNGVSTFDMVKMAKHILQTEMLDNPYAQIAADVNDSGNITTIDVILLRKVVLGIDRKFRGNSSWRFIPADFKFSNPDDPFSQSFPESASVDLEKNENPFVDFVAIKIGDVNGSVKP